MDPGSPTNRNRPLLQSSLPSWRQILKAMGSPLAHRLANGSTVAVCSVLLLYNLAMGPYTRPIEDDWGFIVNARKESFFEIVSWNYSHWSGRYSWLFLVHHFARFGSHAPAIFAVLSMFAWLIVWTLALRRFGWISAFGVAAISLVSCVMLTPDPGQTILWFSAATNIMPPLVLAPLLVSGRTICGKITGLVSGLVFGFVVAGFNEQASLALLSGNCAGLVNDHRFMKSNAFTVGSSLGLFLGTAVSFLAPGNRWRMAHAAYRRLSFPECAHESIRGVLWFYASLVPQFHLSFPSPLDIEFSCSWRCASLMWAVALGAIIGKRSKAPLLHRPMARSILLAWLAISGILVAIIPLSSRHSWDYNERTLFIPFFLLTLTAAASGFFLHAWLEKQRTAFTALLLMSVIFGAGQIPEFVNMLGEMRTFARDWDRQDRRLRTLTAGGKKDVILAPADIPLYSGHMWSPQKDSVLNKNIAEYYGLRSIRSYTDKLRPAAGLD